MGKRLAPVLAFLALWVPVAGYALGLGNITMNSALNQPLDAEIELLSVQSGDLDNLVVKMASSEDFKRVGAERTVFLTGITFSVDKKADGKPYIKMSSTQTVVEPFLDFVIEARWPRGRILREFTVLVDPPVLSEETPAPVQQAVVTAQPEPQVSTTTRNEDFFRRAPEAAPRDVMTPVERQQGELVYGPVKYKDTLWTIANDMKPSSATVNQMMVALVKNNPQAFYNNNVNELKAGYVLRVNNPAEVSALTAAEADAEIERQRADWQARKSGKLVAQAEAPAGGGQVDRAAATGSASQAAAAGPEAEARLKLVAPGTTGAGSGAGSEDVGQLQQDLLLAAEALEANRQETEELKTRLQEMEEQLTAMQRLIALKDDEMALLQQQLSGGEAATDSAAAMTQTAPAEAMSEGATMAEGTTMAEGEQPADAATMQGPQEEPAVQAPAPKPKVMPAPAPVETSFMDEVMNIIGDPMSLLANPMALYGGIGVLVLIVLAVIVTRRRRMQDGFEESILNVGTAQAGAEGAMSGMSGMSSMGESSAMVSDFAMSEMSGLSGIQADASDVDPVSEADVYLAYGRHQQAEDILKEAIDSTPDRHELKLKLLEVYFAAKNREAFEQQAQELHDALGNESDPLWAKAVTMGAQLCPGSDLFGAASAESLQKELAGGDNDEDLLDFDFDFDTSDLDSGKAAKAAASKSDTDEMFAAIDSLDDESAAGDLDFDLDTGDTAVAEKTASQKKSPAVAADNSLDFDVSSLDFNLDEEEVEAPQAETAEDNSLEFDLDIAAETSAESELDFSSDEADLAELESPDLDTTDLAEPEVSDSGVEESALDMDLDLGELSLDDSDEEDFAGKTQMIETDLDFTPSSEKDNALEMDDLSLDEESDELSLDIEDETTGDETDMGELEDLGDDVFGEVDEVGTKLDLARAYVDMGDSDGARGILNEVIEEGDDTQKSQAMELLEKIG